MSKITNNEQYDKSLSRINELLKIVDNDTPRSDKNFVELEMLSKSVAEYETANNFS